MRLYKEGNITAVKLSQTDSYSDRCRHGSGNSVVNLLWECPEVGAFWSEIISIIGEIHHVNFSVSPVVCLLDQKPEVICSFTVK